MDSHRKFKLQELIRLKFKGNRADLLADGDITKGYLSQLLKPSNPFGERAAKSLAEKLGLEPGYFESGVSEGNIANVTTMSAPPSMRKVYLLNTVQAGNPAEVIDSFGQNDDTSFVWSERGGRHTFALKIMGDSMAPEFNEGDTILIDPDVQPSAGRYVVAKCGSDTATFKKYRPRGADDQGRPIFELVPINANYGTLLSDRDRCEIIGVMIEHRINY